MAHVHTNREDRIRDMEDEQNNNSFERRLSSVFSSHDVDDLEPEPLKKPMPTFDAWCEMSQAEKNLYRDIV